MPQLVDELHTSKKHARSSKGRRRKRGSRYRYPAPDLPIGREDFRVVLRRTKRKLASLELDRFVESISWERAGSRRTATLTFHRPMTKYGADLVLDTDRIDLYVRHAHGRWKLEWRLLVATPEHQVKEGILNIELSSDLDKAARSRVAWKIKAGRRAHQVAAEAAKRFHVKVGKLAAGKHKLGKFTKKKASMMDVVNWAYNQEHHENGRRFDVDTSKGRLDVHELKKPVHMMLLGPVLTDATLKHSSQGIASALIVTSTRKAKGKRKKTKLRVKVISKDRLKRFGYIVKTVNKDGLDSKAEAKKWALKELARVRRGGKEVSFTHAGIPGLDRGDALKLNLKEDGTVRQCWVKTVRHDVAMGSYFVDVTAGFSDPYLDAHKKWVEERKKEAAKKRKRASSSSTTTTPPATVKAARRRRVAA